MMQGASKKQRSAMLVSDTLPLREQILEILEMHIDLRLRIGDGNRVSTKGSSWKKKKYAVHAACWM